MEADKCQDLRLTAGDPGELTVSFLPEGWQAQDPERANVSVQVQRPEKANVPVRSIQAGDFLLVLVSSSTDWTRPITLERVY